MKTLLVLAAVMTFAADPTWELELTTGEVLRGHLVAQNQDVVVFEHPVLGRLTIPTDSVRTLRELPAPGSPDTPPPAAPAPVSGDVDPPDPEPMDDAIDVKPLEKVKGTWDSTFSLGLYASSGKTNEGSFRLSLDSVYQDANKRFTFDSFYLYKQTDSIATENKLTAGVRGDWPFAGSLWGYFAQGRYDYDEFQSWRHRVTAGGGFTYLLVDLDRIEPDDDPTRTDTVRLTASGGLGLNKEIGSLNEEIEYEGILGLDFAWRVSRRQRVTVDGTIFPSITDSGEYRFLSRGGWSLRLDNLDGITLNAGFFYEYQSDADPGIDPNDLQFFISMGIDF